MESISKIKSRSKPVVLGVFLMLVTIACGDQGIDPTPQDLPDLPDKSIFSGVQSVLITNSNGTLLESDRLITATLRYQAKDKIVITLREELDADVREFRLEGSIANGSIMVRFVENSAASTYEGDGNANKYFEEYFDLSGINLEEDCPDFFGILDGDKLELSCDFCCSIPGMEDMAVGEVSCTLDRM